MIKIEYAIDRYAMETKRLFSVANNRLGECRYLAGETYTIADMAAYPWVVPWERQGQNLDDTPHLKRWLETIAARPAVQRAYARAAEVNTQQVVSEEARKVLFGQGAETVKR